MYPITTSIDINRETLNKLRKLEQEEEAKEMDIDMNGSVALRELDITNSKASSVFESLSAC